jgi:formate dehydrogenase major subunit
MGISQHVHGTDNARCLIALTLMTGPDRPPGTGLHPLRGQNNVQGASDAGLIPMMFPDYQRVDNPEANARFEKFWGRKLDKKPGLTVVEIMDAACEGKIKGMYIMGENPAMSDPTRTTRARASRSMECLVVQDIFLTETAYLADVVLPASAWPEKTGTVTNTDRMVQLGTPRARHAGRCAPGPLDHPAARQPPRAAAGTTPGPESGVAQVYEEMRQAMNSIGGITWDRLSSNRRSRIRAARRTIRAIGGVHREFPHQGRPRQVRAGGPHSRQRASRCAVSVRAHHRAAARALAHRLDDAPRVRAG